ncbi:MAG: mechanosensitive ion channel [Nitriliruptorales bacterium]|nr:mechanosensitive ion channel [Nitriliruptorales bacterium]
MRMFLAQSPSPGTSGSGVDVDPVDQVQGSVEGMLEGFVSALPGIGIALAILVLFWFIGRIAQRVAEPRLAKARTKSFGKVFSTLLFAGVMTIGLVIALPVAVPSLDFAGMLAGLGIVGVAAGFAFQDILSNLLAGVLLIFRQPFEAGDQIEVDGVAGTVQFITIRETQIKTFGGRLIYVPNKDVYENAIEVQTADPYVRTDLLVGVDYDTDLPRAREVAVEALKGADGVVNEPAAEAFYTEFGASSINLDLRYWTGSTQHEIRRVQGNVVEAIKAAFDDAGIDIPFDIVTLDTRESFEAVMQRRQSG